MALKSKEWFYKKCLEEVEKFSALTHLSWTILKKGVGQSDSTRGHANQAIGAVQGFLAEHPEHIATITAANPTVPFDLVNSRAILQDWRRWFRGQGGAYGRQAFGYNYDTLRGYLTPNLGGTRRGGGGGDDEFKRVFRLMAEFI